MPSPRGRTRATRRRRKARSPGAHRRSAIGMPAARRPSERTVRSIAGTVGVCTQWRRLPVDLLYFLYLALRPSVSDPRHCASSRAQFGDRPRDRTPNRSCDVAASGACRCWPTNLPTIWSASGIRRAPSATLRQSACGRLKQVQNRSSGWPSSAPKKADDSREDAHAPCGRSAAASVRVAANFLA